MGAVAFIHEHVEIALRPKAGRQRLFYFLDIFFDLGVFGPFFVSAEFVDKGADEPGIGGVQCPD